MAESISVFRLGPGDTSDARLVDLARRIFGITRDFRISETVSSRCLRSGSLVVEVYKASGYVWAADEARLWKRPEKRFELLSEIEAASFAFDWAMERELLPAVAEPFRLSKEPTVGGTYWRVERDGQSETWPLDVQVSFPIFIGDNPLIGGGSDVTVTLGEGGEVIAFLGGWRPIQSVRDVALVEPSAAEAAYAQLSPDRQFRQINRRLRYHAAPPFEEQRDLYPVYVFDGDTLVNGRNIPLRQVSIPATEVGPALRQPITRASSAAKAESPQGRSATDESADTSKPKEQARKMRIAASWMSLDLAQANAHGFIDEWKANAQVIFNCGDRDAKERLWNANDDMGVDAANFVFHTGHADKEGWVLSPPDDKELHYTAVGVAGTPRRRLWGNKDLKWMIIAACGPLQDDDIAPKGGSATKRWAGAFDGMHLLLGYCSISADNDAEGRRVSQIAKEGNTIVDSWFRAAREIQGAKNGDERPPNGPRIYVGAMWAAQAGADPATDHVYGYGDVSADPIQPTEYQFIYGQC